MSGLLFTSWYCSRIFDHVEIDRNSIGIRSDLNDDFSVNL
ncbi:hypothetical protein SLEP1_g12471 [Rubroshorea leprosula]|uniref:Uncharacterized protein n=1 Tax=Rubroshorea leprosula TaxID=152421 RepID=A0AAV5IMF9_9ROSI|nr:hypothetical protein SLEP1_g12471 [Rubroshorea leprosula]